MLLIIGMAGSNLVGHNVAGSRNAGSNGTGLNDLGNLLSVDGVFNFRNSVVSDGLTRWLVFLDDHFFGALGILQHALVLAVFDFQIIDSLVEDGDLLFVVVIIGVINSSGVFLRAVSSDLELLVVDDLGLLVQLSIQLSDFIFVLGNDSIIIDVVGNSYFLLRESGLSSGQLVFESLESLDESLFLFLKLKAPFFVGSQLGGDFFSFLKVVIVLHNYFLFHVVLVLSEPPGFHLSEFVEFLFKSRVFLLKILVDQKLSSGRLVDVVFVFFGGEVRDSFIVGRLFQVVVVSHRSSSVVPIIVSVIRVFVTRAPIVAIVVSQVSGGVVHVSVRLGSLVSSVVIVISIVMFLIIMVDWVFSLVVFFSAALMMDT